LELIVELTFLSFRELSVLSNVYPEMSEIEAEAFMMIGLKCLAVPALVEEIGELAFGLAMFRASCAEGGGHSRIG
jgi:hypothetical protein